MSHTPAAAAPLCPDCGRWMSPIRLDGQSHWFCPDCQGDEPDGDYLERLAAPSRPMPMRSRGDRPAD